MERCMKSEQAKKKLYDRICEYCKWPISFDDEYVDCAFALFHGKMTEEKWAEAYEECTRLFERAVEFEAITLILRDDAEERDMNAIGSQKILRDVKDRIRNIDARTAYKTSSVLQKQK